MKGLRDYEREAAHVFLSTLGLYLHDNNIFQIAGPPVPMARPAILFVQALWDKEWERIKPAIEARLASEEDARALTLAQTMANLKFAAELKAQAKQAKPQPQPKIDDNPKFSVKSGRSLAELETHHIRRTPTRHSSDYAEAVHGFSEYHLYGPRGFKHPFKYEESSELWASPSIFIRGRIGGPFSYRPDRPLAEDRKLSIVTAGICGDPPKGRSALDARAALHG